MSEVEKAEQGSELPLATIKEISKGDKKSFLVLQANIEDQDHEVLLDLNELASFGFLNREEEDLSLEDHLEKMRSLAHDHYESMNVAVDSALEKTAELRKEFLIESRRYVEEGIQKVLDELDDVFEHGRDQ